MRSWGRRSARWGALALVVLALASCGGDDDEASPATETTGAVTTGPTGPRPSGEVDLEAAIVEETLPGFEAEPAASGPVGLDRAAQNDPYDDGEEALSEAGFRQALYRDFTNADNTAAVNMALLEFPDDEAALGYARRLTDAFVELAVAEGAREVEVPDMPDAMGVKIADRGAVVLASRNGVMVQIGVAADAPGDDFLAQATEVLQAQLERL